MTITKEVWHKKPVEPSFIQQHLFPLLFYPSSSRGVRENRCFAQALLTAKALSVTNTLLPPCFPGMCRQGAGWSRVRGWSAEGGAVEVGRKKANIYSEARCAEQGQLQRHSPLQQLCNYIQSLHSTESPTTCMRGMDWRI